MPSTQPFQLLLRRYQAAVWLALALAGTLIVYTIVLSTRAAERVQRLQQTQVMLGNFSREVMDAEAGERGFIITGDDSFLDPYRSFLDPYRAGTGRWETRLTQLAVLGGEDGRRFALRVRPLIQRWYLMAAQPEIAARRTSAQAAVRLVQEGTGRRIVGSVRAAISDYQTSLYSQQAAQLQRAQGYARLVEYGTVVALVLAAWLVSLAGRRATTTVIRVVDELVASSRRIVQGDHGVRLAPGPLTELNVLSANFNSLVDALTSQAAELQMIIDSVTDAIFVGDHSGISRANQPGLTMLGASGPEDLRRPVPELLRLLEIRDPATLAPITARDDPFSVALTSGRAVTREALLRRPGSSEDRLIRMAAAPLWRGGQIVGAVTVNSDLSDGLQARQLRALTESLSLQVAQRTRDLQRERDFVSAVIDVTQMLVIVLDQEGRVVRFNAACERLTGHTEAFMRGQLFYEVLLPRGEIAEVQAVFASLVAGHFPNTHENEWVTRSGERRMIAFANSALLGEQAEVTYVIATGLDVTERRRAEETLQRVNTELRRSNEELERFAYVSSHDLQEPLRTMIIFGELLLQHHGAQLDERGQLYLQYVTQGSSRMKTLVDDLLAFSLLNSVKVQPTRVRLDEVLAQVLANLGAALQETGAEVSHDPLPELSGQPGQLGQVMQNLIANALKFRSTGRRPLVHVAAAREGEHWHLTVSDNGIGIGPEYLQQVFTIFQRLHGRSSYPGNGLGLAVVRKVAELHGGTAWAESVPGQGSCFHVTLRASP